MAFDNGMGPLPRTLATGVTCQRYTPGKVLANGTVTPCSVDGEACDGIFNDTITHVENGFGIGLLAPWDGGGLGIAALAYGPVEAGESLIVKVSATDDLPKFASAADEGEPGNKIVGYAALNTSATAEDVADEDGVFNPSLAVRLIPREAGTIVGGETTDQYIDFEIDLADIANGDTITDFVLDFAGEIISDKFVVQDPATTAAKAATLTLYLAPAASPGTRTAVTGGVISLTSANATPRGKSIAGTAVTAANTFAAGDLLSVVGSGVTAFVEGNGSLKIRVRVAA